MIPPRMESGTPVKKFTPMSSMACTKASPSIMLISSFEEEKIRRIICHASRLSQGNSTRCASRHSVVALPHATSLRSARRLDVLHSDARQCGVDDERSKGISQHRLGNGLERPHGFGTHSSRPHHRRVSVQEHTSCICRHPRREPPSVYGG